MDIRSLTLFVGLASCLLSVYIGILALQKRTDSSAAFPFALFMFCNAFYSFTYTMQLLASSMREAFTLFYIGYPALMCIAIFWFFFARAFTNEAKKMTPKVFLPLSIIPIASMILLLTNDNHYLVYRSFTLRENSSLTVLVMEYGPWIFALLTYLYLLVLIGLVYFVRSMVRSKGKLRSQATFACAATLLPWLGNAIITTRHFWLDFTPLLINLCGVLLVISIFKLGMFDLKPVAREIVLDTIRDGVLVFDKKNRLVDINRAAREFHLGLSNARIGDAADKVLAMFSLSLSPQGEREFCLISDEEIRNYKAVIIDVENHNESGGTIVVINDITETVRSRARLEQLVATDDLTKVENRRRFFEHAARHINEARSTKRPISFAMFDLDHFKRVNDERGHTAGDAALVAVCDACRSALRSTDILCRYGGEEFIIILPGATPAHAVETMERVRSAVENKKIETEGGAFFVTASFGVSGSEGGDDPVRELACYVKESDTAMYSAKNAGRNRVMLYKHCQTAE